MFWWIVGIVIVVAVIGSAIEADRKSKEKIAFEQGQVAANASRTTTVSVGGKSHAWSLAPQTMDTWEQSFVLTAADGPSFLMVLRWRLKCRFFINEREIPGDKKNESFAFTVEVDGAPINGVMKQNSGLSGTTVAVYLEGNFIGQFKAKNG